jgi:hypothetical protein
MIRFSTLQLMDEQKCYDYLVEILHPEGLCGLMKISSELVK